MTSAAHRFSAEFALHTPPIDRPGTQVDLSGSYHGPPELLAIMVGAVLEFL